MADAYAKSKALEQKWIKRIAQLEEGPTLRLTNLYKQALRQIAADVAPLAKRLAKAEGEEALALNSRLMLLASRAQSIKEACEKAVADTAFADAVMAEVKPLADKAYHHGESIGYGKLKELGVSAERVNVEAANRALARLGPGTNANTWVKGLAGANATKVNNALVRGVMLGHSPQEMTRAVSDALGGTTPRVKAFVRTEVLGAARAGNLDSYRANDDVVTGWIWNADSTACDICWGMNGSYHPLDEDMSSHVNCRCSADPTTAPADQMLSGALEGQTGEGALPFDPNVEFAKLPEAQQLSILGPSRHAAFKGGELDIRNIPVKSYDPTWGPGLKRASLSEAKLAKYVPPPVPEAPQLVVPPPTEPPPTLTWDGELTFHRALTGSSHGGMVLKDASGKRFAFKPNTSDPWIAEAENAAAQIANHLGVAVPKSRMITFDGKYGQLQEYEQGATPLKSSAQTGHGYALSATTDAEALQVTQHHIFDWLISSHDTHVDNFLVKDGRLIAIDKGQAWKFIKSDKLNLAWHPPGNFGNSIYKEFWNAYRQGLGGDGWSHPSTTAFMRRIAEMPEPEFRRLVQPYLDALPGTPGEKDALLQRMLFRKASVYYDFDEFVGPLAQERSEALAKLERLRANRPVYEDVDTSHGYGGVKHSAETSFHGKAPQWHKTDRFGVTQREWDWMKSYTGSSSRWINDLARKFANGESLTTDERAALDNMDSFISKAPKATEDHFVFRGFGGATASALGIDPSLVDNLLSLDQMGRMIGHVMENKNYLSTTYNPRSALSFRHATTITGQLADGAPGQRYRVSLISRIKRKKGSTYARVDSGLSSYGTSESEVVLERTGRYKVTGVTVTGDRDFLDQLFNTTTQKHDWLRRDNKLRLEMGQQNAIVIELEEL